MPDGQYPSHERLALVVDDSERIREDACALIARLGFRVVKAGDAETGLSLYIRHHPALILLDWALPGMNGLDFLRAMRALPGSQRTQVLICSGNGRPHDIHLAMRAGASEYLLKPFDEDLLAFKLRQVGLLAG